MGSILCLKCVRQGKFFLYSKCLTQRQHKVLYKDIKMKEIKRIKTANKMRNKISKNRFGQKRNKTQQSTGVCRDFAATGTPDAPFHWSGSIMSFCSWQRAVIPSAYWTSSIHLFWWSSQLTASSSLLRSLVLLNKSKWAPHTLSSRCVHTSVMILHRNPIIMYCVYYVFDQGFNYLL